MTAGASDLVTLDEAYNWLGLEAGSDDVGLQLAISGVSTAIASWCTRNFVPATYDEVYDGVGQRALTLRNYPIISVQGLSIDGIAVSAAATPIATGYVANRRTVALNGYRFQSGFQNIAITYSAGFDPIPADLKLACLTWVQNIYLAKDRDPDLVGRRAGDTEEKFGRATVVVAGNAIPMPMGVYAVLSQYRDVVPV